MVWRLLSDPHRKPAAKHGRAAPVQPLARAVRPGGAPFPEPAGQSFAGSMRTVCHVLRKPTLRKTLEKRLSNSLSIVFKGLLESRPLENVATSQHEKDGWDGKMEWADQEVKMYGLVRWKRVCFAMGWPRSSEERNQPCSCARTGLPATSRGGMPHPILDCGCGVKARGQGR